MSPPQSVPLISPLAEPIASRKPPISLEERLGKNWLNKLGIVSLFTGLALLLGYQLRTLGPLGKSTMGVLLSVGILVTGLLLERSELLPHVARAAIGGGWTLLFSFTFALFHIPGDAGSALTICGSCADAHGSRRNGPPLVALPLASCHQPRIPAFLLRFFTVVSSQVTIFSLVAGAILAADLIAVAFRER